MLHFTRTKLVARVLACARAIARIKWKLFIEFMETGKNSKIKNKVKCLQYSTKKGLRISKRQTGLQISTGPSDLHTSTGNTNLLEFTGRRDLRISKGRTGLLELTVHTGFLGSTGRTILEFTGLLELIGGTILLEFTEGIGLRT